MTALIFIVLVLILIALLWRGLARVLALLLFAAVLFWPATVMLMALGLTPGVAMAAYGCAFFLSLAYFTRSSGTQANIMLRGRDDPRT